MPKNQQLLAALQKLSSTDPSTTRKGPGGTTAIDALDDFIRRPRGSGDDFRQSILAKRDFWNGLATGLANPLDLLTIDPPGTAVPDPRIRDEDFLAYHGILHATADDGIQDFATLQKLAAEKRVLLGLKDANDSLLTDIINAPNADGIRQKIVDTTPPLNGRTAFGDFTTIPGWNTADQHVLTDAATVNIQLEAKKQLLINKIMAVDEATRINFLNTITSAPPANISALASSHLGINPTPPGHMNDLALVAFATEKAKHCQLLADKLKALDDTQRIAFLNAITPAPPAAPPATIDALARTQLGIDDTTARAMTEPALVAFATLEVQRQLLASKINALDDTQRNSFLTAITTPPPPVNLATFIATLPATVPLGIDPAVAAKLTDPSLVAFATLETKQQLLSKKIGTLDQAQLNTFLTSITTPPPPPPPTLPILAAATPFNLPAAAAMTDPSLAGFAIRTAAKRGVSLLIAGMSADVIRTNGLAKLNQATPVSFRTNLPVAPDPSAANLHDDDTNEIKGQLGVRFLSLKTAELGADKTLNLEAIAKATTVPNARTELRNLREFDDGGPGGYIDHAVTEKNWPKIRQEAAAQAIKLKIAQCDDLAALNALIAAGNYNEIKDVLASKTSLGYTGTANEGIRNALINNDPTVGSIIAAAHVRKSLLAAEKDPAKHQQLKELIEASDLQFSAKYKQHFTVAPSPYDGVLTNYFNDAAYIKHTREQALIGYAKTKLAAMDGTALGNLVNAANAGQVQTGAQILLGVGVGGPVDNLLAGAHDSGLSQQLRAYAAAEKVVRDKRALDLSTGTNCNDLIAAINDVTDVTKVGNTEGALIATLPAKEKQALQTRLADVLVRNYPTSRPNYAADLTDLAKAKDETAFKDILRHKFAITSQDWVNKESMEQVQKAACTRAIKLGLGDTLKFGGDAHKTLFEFVEKLPLGKQQAILAKPEALVALADARNKTEVERILGGKLAADTDIQALVNENTRLAGLTKIANSEVAKILAGIVPPITLDDTKIAAINNAITTPYNLNLFDAATYSTTIDSIGSTIDPGGGAAKAAVFAAFGLDHTVLNNTSTIQMPHGGVIQTAVEGQHTNNTALLKRHNSLEISSGNPLLDSNHQPVVIPLQEKAALSGFMTLSKNNSLGTFALVQALIQDFDSSKTYAEFIGKSQARTTPTEKYADSFIPPLEKQLTPEAFKDLKKEVRKVSLSAPNAYKTELETQKTEMDAREKRLSDIKVGYFKRSKLERLGEMRAVYWFNPAFQAAAKQNAHKVAKEFRELAKNCDELVTHLNHQLEAIEDQIASLPDRSTIADPTQKKDIEARRSSLNKMHDEVEKELKKYEGTQKVLKGDPAQSHPILKQGLLETLRQAEEGKTDIKFSTAGGSQWSAERYPNSVRDRHFARDWRGKSSTDPGANNLMVSADAGHQEVFDYGTLPGKDEFTEHVVEYPVTPGTGVGTIQGCFIAEYPNQKSEVKKDGTVEYSSGIKLTVNKFPTVTPTGGAVALSPQQEAAQAKARMDYSMAMAMQLVASLGKPPTKDNPITLKGGTEEELKHLWTALMIIGKNDPNMKFDESAIEVISTKFNPDTQIGMFGFKKDSLYKSFEKDPNIQQTLNVIKTVDKYKFSSEMESKRESSTKDVSSMTKWYKEKTNTMKEVEKENKKLEETTKPTLGSGPT